MDWEQLLCRDRWRKSTITNDFREEFERDFDRAIFSTPVKRMQDKAQVFPLEPHDAVRTRLTHSLEVSSVARGLARGVAGWLIKEGKIPEKKGRSIEAIAATCGLIHDIGNPPFGHSGENAIRFWFEQKFGKEQLKQQLRNNEQFAQDFLRFEGNAQSLRLISKLQVLADYKGLNLTFGTLSASCKYTAASHELEPEKDHARSKPGFFASETELVQKIREHTGTGNARNPIAFLVEAADDIVYSVADVEDAVKKDIFAWSKVENWLHENCSNSDGFKKAKEGKCSILGANSKHVADDIHASAFRTAVVGILVPSVVDAFKENYDSLMSGKFKTELVEKSDCAELICALKEFGRRHVYGTSGNLKLELLGRKVICDLMDIFWEGAKEMEEFDEINTRSFPGKINALLSENYKQVFRNSIATCTDLPDMYHRLQLVTDYISGMTDSFASRLHADLHNG